MWFDLAAFLFLMTQARRPRSQKNCSHEFLRDICSRCTLGMVEGAFAEADSLLVASEILETIRALEEMSLAAGMLIGVKIARTVVDEGLNEITARQRHTHFCCSFPAEVSPLVD
jgi:hypothetical protein